MTAAPTLRRWLVFNVVGGLGVVVQLSALAALTLEAGMHYLLATGLAVEIAVVHNFIWHQCWTWRDRAGQGKSSWWKRLLRFQISNGALSVGGNLAAMMLLVGKCGMNYTLADAISISCCSALNFLASDRLVFTDTGQA
ncbi:MAG: GtrA family protein [Terriglobia bacterium]